MIKRSVLAAFTTTVLSFGCGSDIRRTDVQYAVKKEFGGQFQHPITLTGPAGAPCSDMSEVARENGYIRGLMALVQQGSFTLVDSAFVSDSTGQPGTHCAAVLTEQGRRHEWHEKAFHDLDGSPMREAMVDAGPITVEITGIQIPEPKDSSMTRHAEWRTWTQLNELGRALRIHVDTVEFEGDFRKYDDGWHLVPGWKRK